MNITTTTRSNVDPLLYTNTVEAPKNRTLKFDIENLKPNAWYLIKTCLLIQVPGKLKDKYSFLTLDDHQEFCLDDEGHRTPWTSRLTDDFYSKKRKYTGHNDQLSNVQHSLVGYLLVAIFVCKFLCYNASY